MIVLNVIIEDENSEEVDQGELQDWADNYGLTMPVVYDPAGAYMWSHLEGASSVGLPYMEVLAPGAAIDTLGYASLDDAIALAQSQPPAE